MKTNRLSSMALAGLMLSWLDLIDGPMVIETPPDVIGLIDDAWFHYVADFGQVGPD